MSDLISRQAAINAVNDVIADYIPNLYGRYEALPLELASAVNRLPSAQPTAEHVRHGKWEPCCEWHGTNGEIETRAYSCSECAVIIPVDIQDVRFSRGCFLRYCPNCGARMDK